MKIISSLLFCFLSCLQLLLCQSGWTKGKGEHFAKLDFSRLSTTEYYSPNGAKLKTNRFIQNSLNFYGEYGFRDRLSIIVSGPLWRQNAFETTERVNGIGDFRFDLKYRLTKNTKWPIALSIAPEIPTGRANAFAQSKTAAQERINLPTGDGEFNIWTTLAASKSLGIGYVSLFGAYNFRTKYKGLPFEDLYQIGGEIGFNPIKPLFINGKIRSQWATGESKYPELGFVRGDGTTYTLMSAEAFYRFTKRWGISATYLTGNDLLASFRNIYISSFFSVGIIHEFKK
ncbi:MAG: hypothetical protein SH818_01020 [Saprospiraceae bacterium]|nr:hypothetical protein [Saprospiraceae bacterium]